MQRCTDATSVTRTRPRDYITHLNVLETTVYRCFSFVVLDLKSMLWIILWSIIGSRPMQLEFIISFRWLFFHGEGAFVWKCDTIWPILLHHIFFSTRRWQPKSWWQWPTMQNWKLKICTPQSNGWCHGGYVHFFHTVYGCGHSTGEPRVVSAMLAVYDAVFMLSSLLNWMLILAISTCWCSTAVLFTLYNILI